MKINIHDRLIAFTMMVLAGACSSEQMLFERKIADGKIKATKGYFSGIDYLTIEKLSKRTVEYKLLYDCECNENEMSLTKYDRENHSWFAVTDSTAKFLFFDRTVRDEIVARPIVFEPISAEQKALLVEAISKTEVGCCLNPDKPISNVIGFVRGVPLSTGKKK